MKIKVGDEIFGKFGVGKITNIELCENIGDKEGIPMKEVWTNQVEKCVFDIDNGHFEYGLDIENMGSSFLPKQVVDAYKEFKVA